MSAIEMHVFGKSELVAKWRRAASSLPSALQATMATQMQRTADYARRVHLSDGNPLHRRSGDLSRAVTGTSRTSGRNVIGTLGVRGIPYAVIWEKTGSIEHTIVPLNAKALRFISGGQVVFTRRVTIPAQLPRPFLRPSLDENRDNILAALRATAIGVMRAA